MVSRAASLFARPKVLIVSGLALLLVAALVVTLAIHPWASTRDIADPAPGDRVLQTVNLSLQNDGSLSHIGDTIVVSRAQGGNAETTSATYDPSKVVDQVPARVLTAYRTADKSGTNLADLKGFNGRVTIDLTVENLTVKPQQVSYDVAGQSRTTTALVGAPLTVVASAALAKTDASKIITAANTSGGGDATNGVVSKSSDSDVQVQWATILAPPQLAATATLRLVVDAKDFTLPTVDLSVQPGLITDPSVGALVDQAFNPASSNELALQTRTIALVGDVNSVLGRASDTIVRVRKTLSTTSKTLGNKTIGALKSETTNIGNALKSSNSDIKSLGSDLGESLKSANSATLSSLASTVDELEQVLGDTSAKPVKPKITGSGCQQEVAAPGAGGSVYASIARVAGQLEAYASTTAACRDALKSEILSSLGPDKAEDCGKPGAPADSVTCTLAGISDRFGTIAQKLIDDSTEAVQQLDPTNLDPILTSLTTLTNQLGRIIVSTGDLLDPNPEAGDPPTLPGVEDNLTLARTQADLLKQAIDAQREQVLTQAQAARDSANQLSSDDDADMRSQSDKLADELFDQVGGVVPEVGKLSPLEVQRLRSFLTDQPCKNGDDITLPALPPPAGYSNHLGNRIDDRADEFRAQATALTSVAAALNTATIDTPGIGASLTRVINNLDAAIVAFNADGTGLVAQARELRRQLGDAVDSLGTIKTDTQTAQDAYNTAKAGVDAALAKAKADAEQAARDAAQPAITRAVEAKQSNTKDIDEAFAKSVAGLNNAADQITKDSADTINSKRGDLKDTIGDAKKDLDGRSKAALSRVSDDVSGATRDLDATRTMLNRDLNNILADLGNPKGRTGVLGLLGTSATAAGSADFQLSLASDKVSGYQSVRSQDLNGIRLRQAQAEASLKRQAELPAFVRPMPATTEHTTIYLFHLAGGR